MLFKVRDLMINVLPAPRLECDAGGTGCPSDTTCTRKRDCNDSMDVMQLTPYPLVGDPLLEDLRVQLRYALAMTTPSIPNYPTPGLETLDRLEEKVRPQTRQQVEELERKLTAALEELRQMKTQFDR